MSTLIDDFDDGTVSEYGSGMKLGSSESHSGLYSGHVQSSDGYSPLGSGLSSYPSPGDSFELWMLRGSVATYASFAWGGPDYNNAYLVRHDGDGDFYIYLKSGGGYSSLSSDTANTYGASTVSWSRYVVDWGTNGDISVTIYDDSGVEKAFLSTTDTTYQTHGGFGSVAFGGNGGCYIDDAYILGGGGTPPAAPTGLTLTDL
jgi:hypothetical protein